MFREEAGRLTASVMRILGDFDAAEEVVQDALLAAWRQWPADGIPTGRLRGCGRSPAAARSTCCAATVRYAGMRKLAPRLALAGRSRTDEDDRLLLLFTCCHPALSAEAQVALTLRTVCGLSTAEIASAFLVSEARSSSGSPGPAARSPTAGIPYRVPADDELGERLTGVLAVIYLLFNEGYLSSGGRPPAAA